LIVREVNRLSRINLELKLPPIALQLVWLVEFLQQGLHLEPNDRGATTDVFHYREIIPECTNVSVGYHFAHSPKEWLDLVYLEKIAGACAKVQWEKLQINSPTTQYLVN
jgi:hypothetical protein